MNKPVTLGDQLKQQGISRRSFLKLCAVTTSIMVGGSADVVEYLGNEELIHLTVGEMDVVAVIGSEHRVKPGDDLQLKVSLDKVHLFDPESTLAVDKERDEEEIRRGGAARKEEAPASV